ncbi:MAG: hypothetical protein ABR555_15770 [Pyrinomonadaceae bacterium]
MSKSILLSLLLLTCWACSRNSAPAQAQGNQASQNIKSELQYKVPEGWVIEHPTSSMRAAQYKLPKAAGDEDDASLVLYYFGQGQGGSTQANIDRWINQMKQPDGQPSTDKAKSDSLTVNGLKVTTVDVSGRYAAEMSPGSGTFSDKPNYRMRAAVVETPKGSYFAKLVGPARTIQQWNQSFNDYIKSFEFK